MRNVSKKRCKENQNTHCGFNKILLKLCHLWGNVEKYCKPGQATDDNMCMQIVYWITKAIDTHSEYIILISFPQQQRLHECASMLYNTYTACLVSSPLFYDDLSCGLCLWLFNSFPVSFYIYIYIYIFIFFLTFI